MIKHIDHIFDEAWGYLDTEDILKFPFFQQLDKKKKGKKGRGKDAARAARVACTSLNGDLFLNPKNPYVFLLKRKPSEELREGKSLKGYPPRSLSLLVPSLVNSFQKRWPTNEPMNEPFSLIFFLVSIFISSSL